MALSSKEKRALLERTLPQRNQVRKELESYLQRTGLTYQDFAHRVGYSNVAMNFFLKGQYESIAANDAPIRAAIVDFIAAHPVGGGDGGNGGQARLHDTQDVRLIREFFYKALDNRQAYYIHGDPASQKSFTVMRLIEELNRNELSKNGHGRKAYYIYTRQGIRPVDLLKRVAEACGSIGTGNADRIIRNLRFDFRNRKVLLVFDEFQHASVECIETVRELLDMPPHFGLLFLGSHQMEQTFQRLDLEQVDSRMRKGADLPGVQRDEASSIVHAELPDLAPKKVEALIDACYVKSLRKRAKKNERETEPVRYISARKLFWAIEAIQQKAKASA